MMGEYRRFKNGDHCPCCGQVLEGKSEDWLELFSQAVGLWLGESVICPREYEREEETEYDKPEV